MSNMEAVEKLAEIIDGCPLTPESKCFEEHDSWAEWNKYRQESLARAKRVLAAGYLPVEPVQLEVLKDEDVPVWLPNKYYRECADEDGAIQRYKLRVNIPSFKEGSQATIAHNAAKGKLYRRRYCQMLKQKKTEARSKEVSSVLDGIIDAEEIKRQQDLIKRLAEESWELREGYSIQELIQNANSRREPVGEEACCHYYQKGIKCPHCGRNI